MIRRLVDEDIEDIKLYEEHKRNRKVINKLRVRERFRDFLYLLDDFNKNISLARNNGVYAVGNYVLCGAILGRVQEGIRDGRFPEHYSEFVQLMREDLQETISFNSSKELRRIKRI
ncbi:hypothetical protein HYV50_05960 [Candidatus Pacearchaeota archaeon]|nr:hypothetical protein [Candidatus Pacearchaeota archaeon]